MARIRTIKPDFWEDEKLGRLEDIDRLNFLGLISLADDEGRGRGAAEWLCNRLHPYSVNGHRMLMEDSMNRLETANLVRFYEVDGQRFYQLRNFNRHQKINRPSPSKLPCLPEPSVKAHGMIIDASPTEGKGTERSGTEVERSGVDHENGNGAGGSATATPPRARAGPEETERLRLAAKAKLGLTP